MKNLIKLSIVDDQKLFRDGLKSLIKEFSECRVISEANNGKEFTTSLNSNIPDVVLLDLSMPEMDGEETTKYLNTHFPQIKILILTMYDDSSFARHLIMHGAHGFLLKESNIEIVVDAIHSVMENGYFFNEFISRELVEEFLLSGDINPEFKKVTLTKREMEILALISKEYTCKEIADRFSLSIRTVEGHRDKLIKKIGARNTAGLVVFAVQNNFHKWVINADKIFLNNI